MLHIKGQHGWIHFQQRRYLKKGLETNKLLSLGFSQGFFRANMQASGAVTPTNSSLSDTCPEANSPQFSGNRQNATQSAADSRRYRKLQARQHQQLPVTIICVGGSITRHPVTDQVRHHLHIRNCCPCMAIIHSTYISRVILLKCGCFPLYMLVSPSLYFYGMIWSALCSNHPGNPSLYRARRRTGVKPIIILTFASNSVALNSIDW